MNEDLLTFLYAVQAARAANDWDAIDAAIADAVATLPPATEPIPVVFGPLHAYASF